MVLMDEDQLSEQFDKNEELVYIFNPTRDDFTISYDIDGDNTPEPFTVRAREGIKIKRFIADHIAKKLKDEIVGKMQGVITDKVVEDVYATIKFYD